MSATSALSTRFPHRRRGGEASSFEPSALPSPFPSGKRQGGFSLLEVVVAFAILALSLGLLIQIFSRALSTTALSRDYSQATTLAQARLEAVGVDIPLEAGDYGGEPEDGFSWQVHVEPYAPGDLAWEPAFDVFLVTSVATWGEGAGKPRRVSLSTLRLASSSGLPGLTPDGAGEGNLFGQDDPGSPRNGSVPPTELGDDLFGQDGIH